MRARAYIYILLWAEITFSKIIALKFGYSIFFS